MIYCYYKTQGPTVATHESKLPAPRSAYEQEPAVAATYEDEPEDTAVEEEFPEVNELEEIPQEEYSKAHDFEEEVHGQEDVEPLLSRTLHAPTLLEKSKRVATPSPKIGRIPLISFKKAAQPVEHLDTSDDEEEQEEYGVYMP